MSLLVKIFPHHLPGFLRKKILAELFSATVSAFDYPTPGLDHLPYDACLRTYALFTNELAAQALQARRDLPAIKARLYQNALPLGRKFGRWFGCNSVQDVMELGQILYRAIGVEIQGSPLGDVCVKRCYFSQFYSASVCDLISALDDGVFSGLSGGGRLVFLDRITEGKECCRAKLLVQMEANR